MKHIYETTTELMRKGRVELKPEQESAKIAMEAAQQAWDCARELAHKVVAADKTYQEYTACEAATAVVLVPKILLHGEATPSHEL